MNSVLLHTIKRTQPVAFILLAILLAGFTYSGKTGKQIKKSIEHQFDTEAFNLLSLNQNKNVQPNALEPGWYLISTPGGIAGYLYTGRVETCRPGGCRRSDGEEPVTGAEYFDYYLIADTSRKIREVRIFDYHATYGYEITARSWLKQFRGFDGSHPLTAGKEIDGISGATVSVDAMTEEINLRIQDLKLCADSDQ